MGEYDMDVVQYLGNDDLHQHGGVPFPCPLLARSGTVPIGGHG
jgi:hypothetical protein